MKTAKEDTNKVNLMISLAEQYFHTYSYADRNINAETALAWLNKSKTLSLNLSFHRGEVSYLIQYAWIISREYKQYKNALELLLTALDISDKYGFIDLKAKANHHIGFIYYELHQTQKAIEYYQKAYEQYLILKDTVGITDELKNNADMNFELGNKKSALEKGLACLEILKHIDINKNKTLQRTYEIELGNIGTYYAGIGDFKNGEQYILRSINYNKAIKTTDYYFWLIELGKVYMSMQKYDDAEKVFLESFHYADSVRNNGYWYDEIASTSSRLSNLYLRKGDYKNAHRFLSEMVIAKDSINAREKRNNLHETELQFYFNKKEQEASIKEKFTESEHQAEIKRRNIILWSVAGGFLLVFVFSVFIFRSYRQKQKANIIITQQKEEVEREKAEIEKQKEIIAEKNKDITDSINYAKRIQEAILPAKEIKYRIFPDAFVLFQPKDVVSGDFYWFTEKNGKRIIAAVDCTGHGVPGAFMSMIGNAFLNEIVNQRGITQPSEILSELRHNIIHSLKQKDKEGGTQDGMDIALLSFDDENNIAEFAGAHNPLLMCRKENGSYKMDEIPADKRPIGYYIGKGLPFTNQKINLHKGDTLYIFTDGYADQFGGPKGKKFKYKQFQELLLSIQNEPMLKQEAILLDTFNKWKGNLEQVDDVLVIGIRA
ncbi:MAG: SpoIIE family protein phosphatase [Bacteroidetes bacterium]|nr:SpoIIE family protein phosphatase [Bacteroidota bacterium]